jgi:hypothetical protein
MIKDMNKEDRNQDEINKEYEEAIVEGIAKKMNSSGYRLGTSFVNKAFWTVLGDVQTAEGLIQNLLRLTATRFFILTTQLQAQSRK